MSTFRIGMLLLHAGTPRDQEAREQLADALPDAEVGAPDETGAFEIELEADDQERALQRIWDVVAAASTSFTVPTCSPPEQTTGVPCSSASQELRSPRSIGGSIRLAEALYHRAATRSASSPSHTSAKLVLSGESPSRITSGGRKSG